MKTSQMLWAALAVAMVVLAMTLVTHGQNQTAPLEPQLTSLDERMKRFFLDVGDNNVPRAFEDLLADSPLSRQGQAVSNLVQKTEQLESKYGEYRNTERVGVQRLGNDVVLLKYLFHCRNFPVVWYVTFYRSNGRDELPLGTDQWTVVSIRFDTDLELLAMSQ